MQSSYGFLHILMSVSPTVIEKGVFKNAPEPYHVVENYEKRILMSTFWKYNEK